MTAAETASDAAADVARARARARVEEMRRALAATVDARARSRLRVRLADLLSALGDPPSALSELKQAAAESPPTAGLLSAIRALGPALSSAESESLRGTLRNGRAAPVNPTRTGPGAGWRSAWRSWQSRASRQAMSRPAAAPAPDSLPPMARQPEVERAVAPVEAAFAALAEGKLVRARRLGEEASRLAGGAPATHERLRQLVQSLDRQGARRQALLLGRALAEDAGGAGDRTTARADLEAVVARAAEVQEAELASRWRGDLVPADSVAPGPAGADLESDGGAGGTAVSWAQRFLSAQRAALPVVGAETGGDAATGPTAASVVARWPSLLAGQEGAGPPPAALALGERLAGHLGDGELVARAELLRLALEGERSPRRRRSLAARMAETLQASGAAPAALAVLSRTIDDLAPEHSGALRRVRADLLRAAGRETDLIRALESDAAVASGAARAALQVEQAALLDLSGEADTALEVRLRALEETPGHLGLLGPARQRLEAVGRLDRSLELAAAAIPHVSDRQSRAGLLRDVATLAEAAAGDAQRAAAAWLDVLGLYPGDVVAADAAERLLRQLGDRNRLGEQLAWSAARQQDREARAAVLWRLAEFRRLDQQAPEAALPLYREIIDARPRPADGLAFADDDWQRRDDDLAMHTARAMAAPSTETRAQAIAERAAILIDLGRVDEADRDLGRALDLGPTVPDVVRVLERLYERRGDWRSLRHRLASRVEGATGAMAAQLWYGIGRANERMGDSAAARSAYERALAADDGFLQAATMLRQLAARRGDHAEIARLLEKEIALTAAPLERVGLLIELGAVLAEKLDRAPRALEVLDAALGFDPTNAAALEAVHAVALAIGAWEKSAQALETMLGAGIAVADAGIRYHKLGQAAEKAGQIDRALGLYSRSYARNPSFRPTLERLSEICFERQQWDNAWKATEHLLERHGTDLGAATRAGLQLRSAVADLHVAQRLSAANRIAGQLIGPTPQTGLRDVADSWASMRFDPRLLRGLEGDRRARVTARLAEVLSLTENDAAHPARAGARETLAALAFVDRRWADALSLLDGLGSDQAIEPERRCLFLIAAGDILLHQQGDASGAALRYQRARALNPKEPRLHRPGV